MREKEFILQLVMHARHKLCKKIIFNQTNDKDSSITINGVPVTDTVASCNAVNDHFCAAGEELATSIISIHGYDSLDIDVLYPEHSSKNWSFQHVDADTIPEVIRNFPNKKSTSFDKVPIQLLKSACFTISLTIATCLNNKVQNICISKRTTEGKINKILITIVD